MDDADRMSDHFWSDLVEHGVLSQELVKDFRMTSAGPPWVPLGKVMLDEGVLSLKQVMDVLAMQASDPDSRFGEIAVRAGYCTEAQVSQCLDVQSQFTPGSIEHALAGAKVPSVRVIAALASYANYLERRLAASALPV